MTVVKMVKCDGCGKEAPLEDVGTAWVVASTFVTSPQTYSALVEKTKMGEIPWDQAEVCSLVCLANWASARAALRDVERTLEAGGDVEAVPPETPPFSS